METSKIINKEIGNNLKSAILSENENSILTEINKLVELGFGRKEIYILIREINLSEINTEDDEEKLVDFLHELTGYRSYDLIDFKNAIKFEGEPITKNEFVDFIRKIPFVTF